MKNDTLIWSLELRQIAGELHNLRMSMNVNVAPPDVISASVVDAIISTIRRGDPGAELLISVILIASERIKIDFPGIERVAAQAARVWNDLK